MEVKPGYKQTGVGVVPVDWDVRRLDDATEPHRPICYGIVQTGPNVQNGVPCLRVVDINDGIISKTELIRTSTRISDSYRRTVLKAGDLVMPLRGKVGDVAIIDKDLEGANLTRGVALLAIRKDLSGPFFRHFISWSTTRRRLEQSMNGSALQEIPIATLRGFEIATPRSETERCVIAAALNDADELLSGLDRLITKKRDLKQAAMQQLLTGQTRLPGFHGEWQVKPLGQLIVDCFSGATPRRNRPDYFKGDIRWITSGELNYNVITDTIEKITSEAAARTNLTLVPKDTFLMAITGLEAEGTRGACGIVGVPSTTNQSCMAVFPTSELITTYLFYYYVFRGKALALQYCQGTKQQSYTAKLVKQLPIQLPPTPAEQTAIAEVLSDMDAELAALEQRRVKICGLKQAMMQELLTGKIRFV
ncbi:restriction endonuclease subunit S [Bradyrhizobium sp. RT3a]|uniref:restriction endonuclease subunit S n=1 Tax=unclassified Bradyrhizobium TaxID=2631580 RepID=UPI003391D4A7